MKRLNIITAALFLLLIGALTVHTAVYAEDKPFKTFERLGIDEALHGVWMLHSVSDDEGETVEEVGPEGGVPFCNVTTTQVRFTERPPLTVEAVFVTPDGAGFPANAVTFTNGTVWIITKRPGEKFALIHVLDPENEFAETYRFLVTIQR